MGPAQPDGEGTAAVNRTHDVEPATDASFGEDDTAAWVAPSWDELVRTHAGRVHRLAYRLTGNSHDADDLTQEVFVRAFRALPSYTPGTFEGWLHRITTNLFLDGARRRQRIRFDAFADDAGDRLAGSEPDPGDALVHDLLEPDVEAALQSLSPEFRAAVVLCDIEGLSYDEVARVLDVKLGTVRSRISRGRAQLRASLAHRAPRPAVAAPGNRGPRAAGTARDSLAGQR